MCVSEFPFKLGQIFDLSIRASISAPDLCRRKGPRALDLLVQVFSSGVFFGEPPRGRLLKGNQEETHISAGPQFSDKPICCLGLVAESKTQVANFQDPRFELGACKSALATGLGNSSLPKRNKPRWSLDALWLR